MVGFLVEKDPVVDMIAAKGRRPFRDLESYNVEFGVARNEIECS